MLQSIVKELDPSGITGTLRAQLIEIMAEICYQDVLAHVCTCRLDICAIRKHYGVEFAIEVRDQLAIAHPDVLMME